MKTGEQIVVSGAWVGEGLRVESMGKGKDQVESQGRPQPSLFTLEVMAWLGEDTQG